MIDIVVANREPPIDPDIIHLVHPINIGSVEPSPMSVSSEQ
jgi:hypothetical protein